MNLGILFIRGYKISKCFLWTPKTPNTFRVKKMKDTAAACPGVLPICSTTRPIWRMTLAIISNFQYKPRILVFFSNPLFRVSRMSEYSCAYTVSLNFFFVRLFASFQLSFFWCAFLCILGDFSLRTLSCQLIQFCPENQGFSLLRISCKETPFFVGILWHFPRAYTVLQNSFFARTFSNFPKHITALFFVQLFVTFHIYGIPFLCALLRIL